MQLGAWLMESSGEEASWNHQETAGKWQGWKELWKQHPRCRDHGGAGAPPARARSPRVRRPPPRPCPADTSPPCCKDSLVLTSCPLSELLACISNCQLHNLQLSLVKNKIKRVPALTVGVFDRNVCNPS